MIATKFETNHHLIKRMLLKAGVEISGKGRKKTPPTPEQRALRGARRKARHANGEIVIWSKGKKMPKDSLYKNMAAHLQWDVELNWLTSFDDIEKLKFLNKVVSRYRMHFDTQKYTAFIENFYFDDQFNRVYKKWLLSGKNKWFMPSIDHIHPRSLGGDFELTNLRFITWLENRTKADMSFEEWESIKSNILDYFV